MSLDDPMGFGDEGELSWLQIISAEGWFARYKDGDAVFHNPLACWVLVQRRVGERAYQYVSGWDGDSMGVLCDDADNFVKYVHYTELAAPQDDGEAEAPSAAPPPPPGPLRPQG